MKLSVLSQRWLGNEEQEELSGMNVLTHVAAATEKCKGGAV